MSDDMSLNVVISADASQAIDALGISQASMDKLTLAIGELTSKFTTVDGSSTAAATSITKVGASGEVAAAGAKVATGAISELGLAMDTISSHSLMLSRGLEAAGASAAASTTKIAALGDAIAGFESANPAILAVVAALAVLAGAFSFVKDGIEGAQQLQQAMTRLGIAVSAAGGDFSNNQDEVEKWAESMALAAGIVAGDAVDALNRLVVAGATVHAAMAELSVGAQMVAQGMGDWAQVTKALTQAQGDNYMLLGRLDPAVKALIKDHADLSTIMEKVEQDTKNALTGNQSLTAEEARLHGEVSNLSDALGKSLLPALQNIVLGMSVVVDACGHVGAAFFEMESGAVQATMGVIKAVGALGSAIADMQAGNFSHVAADLKNIMGGLGGAAHGVGTAVQGIGKAFDYAFHPVQNYAADTIAAMDNVKKHAQDAGSAVADAMPGKAGKKPGTPAPGFNVSPDAPMPDVSDQVDQYKVLASALDDLPKSIQGYEDALTALSLALTQAHTQQDAADAAYTTAGQAATAATDDYNTYKNSFAEGQKLTAGQTDQLKQYDDAMKSANATLADAKTAYQSITGDVRTLTDAQAKEQAQLQILQGAWGAYMASANAKMQEDLATFKMTNAEKVVYYAGVVAQLGALGDGYEKQREQAESQELDSYSAMLKQEYQAQQEFQKQAASGMSSFLDGIIVEHKSMADMLKTIYDDILKSFIDMVAKMIAESQLFNSIASFLGGGGGGGFSGMLAPGGSGIGYAGAAASAASSGASGGGGVSGGMSASSGAGYSGGASPSYAAAGSRGSSSSAGGGFSGAGAAAAGGGGFLGSLFGGGGSGGSMASGAGSGASGGFGGTPSSAPGGGGWSNPVSLLGGAGSKMGGLGGLLGGIGMAGGAGALLGQTAFGGKGYADLGGAIGGIGALLGFGLLGSLGGTAMIAALLSNPIGWGIIAGGALLGAFAGSLFGDHFSHADEPDIYNQDAWGQENADMQGMMQGNPMNANGKQYVMDSWTSQATGGKGWNVLMENFVAQFRGKEQNLPADLQEAFTDIEGLWGGATNHPYFNGDGKDGFLDIGSGQRAQYSTFWGYVQQYGPEIAALMANYQTTPVYDASTNGAVVNNGSYTPSGSPLILHNFNDGGGIQMPSTSGATSQPGAPGYGSGPTKGSTAGDRVTNFNINVPIGGSLISERNMQQAIRMALGTGGTYGSDDMQNVN
jgi:hypothetical protein